MQVIERNMFLINRVVISIAFLGLILLSPSNLFSQDSNFKPYPNNANSQNAETRAEEIVEKNIERAFDSFNDFVDKHGETIAESVPDQKDKETRFGHQGPERHPLDKLGGKLDPVRSKNEYSVDSRTILNDITFPQCMEPRLIAEKKDGQITIYDPANSVYSGMCAANCPPLLFIPNRNWQVVSYYWPEYQVSVNRAGAQMIDPDIVNENRGQRELYRIPTSISEQTDQERGQSKIQLELLKDMGIPTEKHKNPDYHNAPREFFLRQQGELRYPSAMRPNAFWRAANLRRLRPLGYRWNETCLFNGLDLPTGNKKIIANRYDQGIYAILARYPEVRKTTDPERYRYTSIRPTNIDEIKADPSPTEFRESLCASWRLGSNQKVYEQLRDLGFDPENDKKYLDYCLPGGYSLSGSMVYPHTTPRLQADAARVVMAATYFSNDSLKGISDMNKGGKRTTKFTLYSKRKNSSVDRYVNFENNPGENNSKIVFLDKMQRIYPTQPMGDADGKGGESSSGVRTGMGERGSHCFRPEDIPNWSSEGKTNKSEWPLGLSLSSKDHFGETRWAIWNRRIICTCEDLGLAGGCLTLNDGDNDEDQFAGTIGYSGRKMPPAFEKAIPKIRGLADEKGPPSSNPRSIGGLNIKAPGDSGVAGSTIPIMPGREGPPPEINMLEDLSQFLLCILPEDQGKPQDQENQEDQNQENENPENESPHQMTQAQQDWYNSLPEEDQAFLNAQSQAYFNESFAIECAT